MTSWKMWTVGTALMILFGAVIVALGVGLRLGLRGYGPLARGLAPTQTPHPTLAMGSTMVVAGDGMTTVFVPAGDFVMGSARGYPSDLTSELPEHVVYVDAFWIDRTEVTNRMYAACVADEACTPPARFGSQTRDHYYDSPEFADFPVVYVDWHQANTYCAWAGRRLPTEAEWEKAARGTDGQSYSWGNTVPDDTLLNYDSAVGDTTRVGSYPGGASPYGALDMLGNVLEWVADCFDYAYYQNTPRQNPTGPTECAHQRRVIRGSSSFERLSYEPIGVADRSSDLADRPTPAYGFRCALSP